jgi:hypothetical protein
MFGVSFWIMGMVVYLWPKLTGAHFAAWWNAVSTISYLVPAPIPASS